MAVLLNPLCLSRKSCQEILLEKSLSLHWPPLVQKRTGENRVVLYDRISGFIWLFLGLIICVMSYRIDLGEAGSPGPGFIPFLTGCLLILLSFIFLVKSFLLSTDSRREKNLWKGLRWDKPLLVVIALFAYILLLPVFGYLVVTLLFMVFLGKLIQPQKWTMIIIISILSVAASYLIFGLWLNCQFPKGVLKF